MPTVLITGASRGLGLEFTRQYLADGNTVIAACRSPDAAPGLAQLARRSKGTLSVVQVDVADTHSARRSSSAWRAASGGSSSRSRAAWGRSPTTPPAATFHTGRPRLP